MTRFFNRFGDEYTGPGSPNYQYPTGNDAAASSEYTGPGSPSYQYSTPSSDVAAAYLDQVDPYVSAVDHTTDNYVGEGSYVDPNTGTTVHSSRGDSTDNSDYSNKTYGPVYEPPPARSEPARSAYSEPAAEGPGFDWGGMFKNIFGQTVNAQGQRPPPPPPKPAMPTWVIPAAIGASVLVLGALAFAATSRRAPSVAGYRKRRRKRSR